jgi:hypothetical protein
MMEQLEGVPPPERSSSYMSHWQGTMGIVTGPNKMYQGILALLKNLCRFLRMRLSF